MSPLFTGSKFGFTQSGLNYTYIPEDPYFSNVSLLLHMNGDNNSKTFVDSSSNLLTITTSGDTKISTSQSKFGGTSGYFDGTGDSLATPSTSLFDFTGDFTIEFWINPDTNWSLSARLFSVRNATSSMIVRRVGSFGLLLYSIDGGSSIYSGVAPTTNVWSHFALVKYGSTTTMYLDGTSLGSTTASPPSGNRLFELGTDNGAPYFYGYIDEVRVSKGVARYTSSFTVPTAPFPNP